MALTPFGTALSFFAGVTRELLASLFLIAGLTSEIILVFDTFATAPPLTLGSGLLTAFVDLVSEGIFDFLDLIGAASSVADKLC